MFRQEPSTGSGMPGNHHGVSAAEGHGIGRGRPVGVSVAVPPTEVKPIGRGQRPKSDDTLALGRPVKDIYCYKCGERGHYQGRCGKCTRCGEAGHLRNDCPHWPKGKIVCWRCNEVGHYQYECTKLKDKTTQTEGPHEDQRSQWRQPQQQ